jgi:translation initiation factor IF-3
MDIYCAEIILNNAKERGIKSAKEANNLAENLSLDLLLYSELPMLPNSSFIKFSQYQRFKNKATICDYFKAENSNNKDLTEYLEKITDEIRVKNEAYFNTRIYKVSELTCADDFYKKSANDFSKKIKLPVQKEGLDFEETQKVKKLLKIVFTLNILALGYLIYQKYFKN